MLFITVYSFATSFSPVILLVIFIILLQLLFSVGMGMLFSALLPYVRDLGQVLSQVLAGLFFLSPIIYSMEAVHGKIKILFQFNPLTYFIVSYHKIILLREIPDFFDISVIVLLTAGALACGFYAFNRLKEGFPDVL
jgi:ABC-type polysaccharide/polyol phosphate export permease